MMITLRKSSGVRFILIQTGCTGWTGCKSTAILHILSILFEFLISLYRGSDDHSDPDYQSADNDRECGIVILFDLLFYRERRDQHDDQERDREYYQPDHYEDNGRKQHGQKLFELHDHSQKWRGSQ